MTAGEAKQLFKSGETNDGPGAPQTQECPYCGETIRADAVTCRFCKRDLHNPNAPKLVLDESEWITHVPDWMREVERKALARRLFFRKLRRNSWKIVGIALAPGLAVILWRVTHMPPDPHDAAWQKAGQRALQHSAPSTASTTRVSAVAAPVATPASTPTPLPTATPTPAPIARSEHTPAPEPSPILLSPVSGSPSEAVKTKPAYTLTADNLSREFLSMRQNAEDKYVGETIRVTGAIHEIDTTGNVPTFLLGTAEPFVKCFLPPHASKTLAKLRPGASVTVVGNCDGAFNEVLLSECTLE